jgi:hypothetical protein
MSSRRSSATTVSQGSVRTAFVLQIGWKSPGVEVVQGNQNCATAMRGGEKGFQMFP